MCGVLLVVGEQSARARAQAFVFTAYHARQADSQSALGSRPCCSHQCCAADQGRPAARGHDAAGVPRARAFALTDMLPPLARAAEAWCSPALPWAMGEHTAHTGMHARLQAPTDAPRPRRPPRLPPCSCMLLWVCLSTAVILINKYILSMSGFPYPVALTCSHMLFCSILASALVRAGWAEAVPIGPDLYIRWVQGACRGWVLHAAVHGGCAVLGTHTRGICAPARARSGILPIGLLFACTLWTGNAAYLYLSVSFIQVCGRRARTAGAAAPAARGGTRH